MNKLIYVAAGLIAFVGFILVMAPASIAVSLAGDQLKQVPDLRIGQIDGRIWSGSAQIQYRQFPARLSWNLSPLPLLAGKISADLEVQGEGLDASFHLAASDHSGMVTNALAQVDASYINQVSVDYGLELSGQFNLVAEEISFTPQWLTGVNGKLDWPGGMVHIETPQQLYSVDLPALSGDLSMQGDQLQATIDGPNERFIDLKLKPTGWVEVGISYAFLELAGLPLPGNSGDSTVGPAVLLEEKIL